MDQRTSGRSDEPDTAQEEADLAESLTALSQLSSGLGLDLLLTQVAAFATRAIPGADGAGLTLLEPDRPDLIVKSAEFVKEIDGIQYAIKEGPCISAADQAITMRSGSLGGDQRWPRFGPRASRLGVHSVLSLPLITPGGVVGAMNVYAFAKHAFDDRAETIGEIFAIPAAISVHNAHILAQTARATERLQTALISRGVIDQAIGILRSRGGGSAEQAFDRLRAISQSERTKLTAVATAIVDEAVRRADSRRSQ